MKINLYNTLTHKKETFKPLKVGSLSMYQCGPTVYDTPHIGNYRTFVMDDLIRRIFEYNDYKVNQVMNITDVDDKTIRRSREESLTLKQLTEKYEALFIEDIQSLNILRPLTMARATDYVPAMIELVSLLLSNGVAYKATDGIYLHIDKVKDYGQLANLDLAASTHERIANDEYDKDNPRDFAVWKFATAEDGDVHFEAPFGSGRPGWHIECSAMSMKLLGLTIDIHTGGSDLIFPHHTNEIAQSESATGKKFVNYWLHGAFMTTNNEKMAKSKGNIMKLSSLVDQGISPLAFRYWLLTAHYRQPVNFTIEAVKAAQTALIRLITIVGEYSDPVNKAVKLPGSIVQSYRERFLTAINDDLNTPQAIALMWELVKDPAQSGEDKLATILDFDRVFGLKLDKVPQITKAEIPPEITALAEAREEARKGKDWEKADALRGEIESRGFTVNDTAEGIFIVER